MAVTHKQLINRVLRVLQEDEIATAATSLDDSYHQLVATFVNLIREEVEDATLWRKLRHTETITVPAGTTTFAIPNTNERSRLYREQEPHAGLQRPMVLDVTTANNEFALQEMDLATLLRRRTLDSNADNTYFVFFSIDDTSGDEVDIQLYPTATTERMLNVTMVTPQDRFGDLSTDDPGLDTNILVPSRPVELGALWYALEERGEELGVNGIFSEQRYRQALDDAVARDAAEQGLYDLIPA